MHRRTLTILAPVYNEQEVIESFLLRCRDIMDAVADRYDSELLLVVDKSTDATLDILKRLARTDPRMKVLALSSRFGHQMSLLAGLDHANSDAVIMMDSDLQHPPELIPALLEKFEQGYDVVQTIRKDTVTRSIFKRKASDLFYKLANAVSDISYQENAADFRLFSRRVVTLFQTKIRERSLFIRGIAHWIGFKRAYVEYDVLPREKGKSKYGILKLFSFAMLGMFSFSKKPLHIAMWIGFIISLIGIAHAVLILIIAIYSFSLPPGWLTLITIVTLFSGTQLICIGIVGEYVAAIFDEVKQRPHYIVEEEINMNATKEQRP